MNKRFWPIIIALGGVICPVSLTFSVPASKRPVKLIQPDSTVLSVYLKGDEFFHYARSIDGYLLLPDEKGNYTYAEPDKNGSLIPGKVTAHNPSERNTSENLYLKTIRPGLSFSPEQLSQPLLKRMQRSLRGSGSLRSSVNLPDGLINNYPTRGTVKSLIILVNFSDVSFRTPSPNQAFDNLLNQKGYNKGKHIGSVRDYFVSNSGSLFQPEFEVVGPVTLSHPMSYYGANDKEGDDLRPAYMVKEACEAVDSVVDFSAFDADSDGFVDAVYIFYAGYGEADSGNPNTIWPHSWNLSGQHLSLTLDGKKIDSYACSAELKYDGEMTGIGVFTHEYAHILGLPDLYDVDADTYNGEGFDLGEWSLMAYGSYNGDGDVPAGLSLLEKSLLGWATPIELNRPATLTLRPFVVSNQGYIINTSNNGEYFLLENRQPLDSTWDAFLPYHGLLIYHIDRRENNTVFINYWGTGNIWSFANLWHYNMVNAISNHQCADIEEADNERIIYKSGNYTAYRRSIQGAPFPGTSGIQAFGDETTPSMRCWNNSTLNKPISDIRETDSHILFDFMGGEIPMPVPTLKPAQNIQPFSFTASWSPVSDATGYYTDVYSIEILDGDTLLHYLDGFENKFVTDTSLTVHVPSDQTTYYYQVRSTDGFSISCTSPAMALTTTNSQIMVQPASDVTFYSFMAHWKPVSWATGYLLSVYEIIDTTLTPPAWQPVTDYQDKYLSDSCCLIADLDHERTYLYFVQATNDYATGKVSDSVYVTTSKATAIIPYYRDNTLYVKGADRLSSIHLYNLSGHLVQSSSTGYFKSLRPGFYVIEALLDGIITRVKWLVP